MNPHAHTHLGAVRPGMLGKGTLSGDCGRDRILGPYEGHEERVALRIDLVAPVRGESLAQEDLVIPENVAVAVAQLLQEPSRPLDVGEEKSDSADGKLVHRPHGRFLTDRSRLYQARTRMPDDGPGRELNRALKGKRFRPG